METVEEEHGFARLAWSYKKCRKCSFVLKLPTINENNLKCPACEFEDSTPSPFFDLSLCMMIDLMHESYRTGIKLPETSPVFGVTPKQAQNASVVIFFCTIRELLLERFLSSFIRWFALPVSLIKRVESDYDTHERRLNKLFPALTGQKWIEVISSLKSKETDFVALDLFLKRAATERNNLLHEGDHFGMDDTITKECIVNLFSLVDLFVALNNLYIHQMRNRLIQKIKI
jgi:hypothetical protein